MHCPFCGNTLSPSARICYNCGHEFRPQSDYKDVEGTGCFPAIIGLTLAFLIMWLVCWFFCGINIGSMFFS